MKAHPSAEGTCPLAAVDRRLADAHRLWHQAEAAYFQPDDFRLAVQNAIQTLRTVTLILQNHKDIIPEFNFWYGDYVNDKKGKRGKWQERLYTDPLLRWLVDARNRIEKQGDLDSRSFVRAEILASYTDDGPHIDVPAHLFDNIEALLRGIPENALGAHIRRNGALRIQRRWVESALPAYELLDAVAIAYGKISELVHDAHRQIGLDPPQTIHDDEGKSYDLPAMGWRLPCMIGHDAPRTQVISLADGSEIQFETKSVDVKPDAEKITRLLAHYGGNPFEAMVRDHKSNTEVAIGYFTTARAVFLRDGYHKNILFFFRDRKLRKITEIIVENVQHKYVVMRRMADEVTKSGADAVVLIGEAWTARADQLKPYERPADSPVRTEALVLNMVSKGGEPLDFSADIIREGEKFALGPTQVSHGMPAFEFAAFYKAWGRPVPQMWMDIDRARLAAAKR